jgi:two-component system, OmpR family, response regulator
MTDKTSEPRRILVVEDEPSIRTLLESTLRLSGYQVSSAATGRAALLEVERFRPDLLLLDVMLPDLDGYAVTRSLRASGVDTPVLFLTARSTVSDRIRGLSAGGDDYVGKPFSTDEVLLRIRAILRRSTPDPAQAAQGGDGVLHFADLELDERAHEVRRAGQVVQLSPTEFNLLGFLMAHPNQVLTKRQILTQVWRYDFDGDASIVDTYVKYLRRKVDCYPPPLIHTVRGIGYSLRVPRERPDTGAQR